MFDNKLQNLNTSQESGKGVFNQFVAPITTDNFRVKKDPVRNALIIIFIIVVILAIGSVFLSKSLESMIQTKQNQLNQLSNSQNVIQFENNLPKMRNLSQQLKLLTDVYNSRQYISSMFFPVLGSLTESTRISYVYFNRISLQKDTTSNLLKINLSGVAMDYPTLYRQVNNFKSGPNSEYIHNFKLQNFSMNKDQNVEFNLAFDIEVNTPAYLKYLKVNNSLVNGSSTNLSSSVNSGPLYDRNSNDDSQTDVSSTTIDSTTSATTSNIDFDNVSSSNNT